MRTAVRTFSLLLVCFVLACSDDPVSQHALPTTPGHPDAIALNREADEAALWLSGELTSPGALYTTIASDLAAIRAQYSTAVPAVAVEFTAWWLPSELIVYVNDDLKQKILTHQATPLDEMNSAMGAAEVDSRRLAVGKNYVFIYFVGRKHPQRLAEQYMSVAGVTGAYPDGWIGDRPNVYPWYIPDGMSYLVRDAFDDCPAGCIENIFHYFKRVNGQTEYVGSYHLAAQPEPAWWAEAKVPFYVYLGGQDPRTFH